MKNFDTAQEELAEQTKYEEALSENCPNCGSYLFDDMEEDEGCSECFKAFEVLPNQEMAKYEND